MPSSRERPVAAVGPASPEPVVPLPRRELFVDQRGRGLRATWHADQHITVFSLWHDDVCVGSFRMEPRDAGRLIAFLAGQLARQATPSEVPVAGTG